MTPYLTRKAAEAMADGRNTQSWMIAALTRTKKMPKLDDLLNRKSAKGTMEDGLKAAMKSAVMTAQNRKGKRNG